MRLSKKTSEAGVWIPDEEVLGCMQCKGKFSLLNRKHHCRQCGSIVCGKCSTQRKFMESSRTGTPKRVCDTCFNSDRKPEPEDDEEDEPPTGKMDNLRVSGSGASAPAPAAARAASARNLSVKLPEISMEEAVEALRNHPFEGKWKFVLTFLVVDIGPNRGADGELTLFASTAGLPRWTRAALQGSASPHTNTRTNLLPRSLAAVVSGLQVGSFKSAAAINAGGKRGTLTKDGHVRTGSRVQLWLTLKPKGAAYFQGECSEFGQFGKDGKVTGALQVSVIASHSLQCVGFRLEESGSALKIANRSLTQPSTASHSCHDAHTANGRQNQHDDTNGKPQDDDVIQLRWEHG